MGRVWISPGEQSNLHTVIYVVGKGVRVSGSWVDVSSLVSPPSPSVLYPFAASPPSQMLQRKRAKKRPGCGHWVAMLTRKTWIIALLPPMEPQRLPRLRTSTW